MNNEQYFDIDTLPPLFPSGVVHTQKATDFGNRVARISADGSETIYETKRMADEDNGLRKDTVSKILRGVRNNHTIYKWEYR